MSFLQASGTRFTLDGAPYVPFGGSIYGMAGGPSNYDPMQAKATSMGMNCMRYIHYKNMSPDIGSEFNETDWARVDYDLDQARQGGFKVHLDLANIEGIVGARGYSVAEDDPEILPIWEAFVAWLGVRVNTVNGRIYSQDDTIGIIAICGEIAGLNATTATNHYNGVGGYLKTAFPNTLITSGGQVLSIMPTIIALPNIDCVSLHDYDPDASQEVDFPQMKALAIAHNKPWFLEECGAAQTASNDNERAQYFRRMYTRGFKYGCAAFLFWNIDGGVGAGFGVNENTPATFKMVKTFSRVKAYSPRIPVEAAQFGGN